MMEIIATTISYPSEYSPNSNSSSNLLSDSCDSLNDLNLQLPTPGRSPSPSLYSSSSLISTSSKSDLISPLLPLTPPSSSPTSSPFTSTDLIPIEPLPTKFNKPTILIPSTSTLPSVHSGSITENFRSALKEINLDECEAHGENAFFVCDLAEVYNQHMRWMKELGSRVEAFFGELNSDILFYFRLVAFSLFGIEKLIILSRFH